MTRGRSLAATSSVDDARRIAVELARSLPPLPAEEVDVACACDRVLARGYAGTWDVPTADASVMDGWAVRAGDVVDAAACGTAIVLARGPTSAAGHPADVPLAAGHAARVFTGAVLPQGSDAVVPQEQARVLDDGRVAFDPEVASEIAPGRFVRRRGREIAVGAPLLPAGHRLDAGDLALLAAGGHARVAVVHRPRVAILGTGDELVAIGTTPGPGRVTSSNGIMLAAAVKEAAGQPWIQPDARDEPGALQAALADALRADVVLVSGGISVGDHDGVRPALEALGARVCWHGVRLRPGKPTALAIHGTTMVFALPGNPASSFVAFELLVRPALAVRSGCTDPRPRMRASVVLARDVHGERTREHWIRARWLDRTRVEPLPSQQSGDVRSIAGTDVLVRIEAGVDLLSAGSRCDALVLRPPPEAAS